jgi:hypothetical protein
MVRELACWPITYQRDPIVQEHRNIGVLVHEHGESELVLMGYDHPGTVEPAYFCKAFGFADEAGWVYHEWVRWFRVMAQEVTTEDGLETEFSRLKASGSHFGAGDAFRVSAANEESAVQVATRLFGELVVLPPIAKPAPSFLSQVEHLVRCSEIEFKAPFHRNIELEIELPGQPLRVQLPYFSAGEQPLGIKLLRFKNKSHSEVASQINDILYVFDALLKNNILISSRCIVIHDTPKESAKEHLARLGSAFQLMSLDDSSSSSRLWEMVPMERR